MSLTARITNTASRSGAPARMATRAHAWAYRRLRGRGVARWFGADVMVLETVGRRTGRPRSVPVIYVRDGEDLVALAANAGLDAPPSWWLNLRDAGHGVAVVGTERRTVRPRVAQGEERERLWAKLVVAYPPAADYPRFTDRVLPVVVLEPVREGA
jgi:deazaflavin-dependent oxidoreductase (nitroreductase family)